ncbi:hypothetical protein BDZ91DRAFT_719208 [Kalaharituber pfeilii]|nr:hypothetical protein BDZ91DRAFT_719208 [Kalaharituber pfeilii]
MPPADRDPKPNTPPDTNPLFSTLPSPNPRPIPAPPDRHLPPPPLPPPLPTSTSLDSARQTPDGLLANLVARELCASPNAAENNSANYALPLEIGRMVYQDTIALIADYVSSYRQSELSAESPDEWTLYHTQAYLDSISGDEDAGNGAASADATAAKESNPTGRVTAHLIPTTADYLSALKVLHYLSLPHPPLTGRGNKPPLTRNSTFDDIMRLLAYCSHLSSLADSTGVPAAAALPARQTNPRPKGSPHVPYAPPSGSQPIGNSTRSHASSASTQGICYICHYRIPVGTAHPFYQSMCFPCGSFHLSSNAESLPENLSLNGRTAVVTGGRVNLGHRTALRLLRCGASVLVTSRYPADAVMRYMKEPDVEVWGGRLRIVGADFRRVRDAFGVAEAVTGWLLETDKGCGKLDILINNAAQTITDKAESESAMVLREERLLCGEGLIETETAQLHRWMEAWVLDGGHSSLSSSYRYVPAVLGGVTDPDLERPSHNAADTNAPPTPTSMASTPTTPPEPKPHISSWAQTYTEIPYRDLITAHSINLFTPFLLTRELLPNLSLPRRDLPPHPAPTAYVLNLTARESILSPLPGSRNKNGTHTHTNMYKAALHMLTHCESAPLWRSHGIAMNSVDPGYLSFDEEWMRGRKLQRREAEAKVQKETGEGLDTELDVVPAPLGWEDGVGRTLWAVARGEAGEVWWGRFFKHYTPVRVVGVPGH